MHGYAWEMVLVVGGWGVGGGSRIYSEEQKNTSITTKCPFAIKAWTPSPPPRCGEIDVWSYCVEWSRQNPETGKEGRRINTIVGYLAVTRKRRWRQADNIDFKEFGNLNTEGTFGSSFTRRSRDSPPNKWTAVVCVAQHRAQVKSAGKCVEILDENLAAVSTPTCMAAGFLSVPQLSCRTIRSSSPACPGH